MTEQRKSLWERIAYFVANILIPLVAVWTLSVAKDALIVARDTLRDGAAVREQVIQIHQLTMSYEELIATNKVLKSSLDSLHQEIIQTKKSADIGLNQYQISKQSFSIILEDKAYSKQLDSQALFLGTSNLRNSFYDLNTMLSDAAYDDDEGPRFDSKMVSMKSLVAALVANRFVMAKHYLYRDLISFLDLINNTHSVFNAYHHVNTEVDHVIMQGFCRIGPGLQYIEKDEPASDKSFQQAYLEANIHIYKEAEELYKKANGIK